ncbi:MAG: 3-hydroxyacyl-CoA dehydrogenase NAD-binding domain-containing protein [Hyphomicrobiales bacterium]
MPKHFSMTVGEDGVAVVTFDSAGRPVNLFDESAIEELAGVIDRVIADPAVKGVLLRSGKPDMFCAGADVTLLERLIGQYHDDVRVAGEEAATRSLQERSSVLSRLLRKLETGGKPVVVVITGPAMGGGLELALACHHRIAEDSPKVKLALPEATIGVLPGAGGTQRLPRLAGPEAALAMMLKGRAIGAAEALKTGVVHQVAPKGEGETAARAWLKGAPSAVQTWDAKGYRLKGGEVYSAEGMRLWPAINALYRKETYDLYEGRRGVLKAVYDGLTCKSMDAALKAEEQRFTEVLRGAQAPTQIRTMFHSMRALAGGDRRPKDVPQRKVQRLGIVGAGFMGSGIAYVSARAGIDVVLLDRDLALAEKGKAHSASVLDRDIARGAATEDAKQKTLARIHPAADYQALAACDLVIEAVFESREVKKPVLEAIDAVLKPYAFPASNTSTLPITSLAALTKRPSRFIGIHFFSPVDRMQLVELIMGKETGPEALALAIDYVRQIGKTPIVVNDSRGFFTSRVVTTYMAEGHHMLAEGVPPALIENAARMAGMPVGPLALNDEVALDLTWKIMQATKADLGPAYEEGPMDFIVDELVNKRGRFGRKNGKGFYDYPEGAKKKLWPGIGEIAPARSADGFDVELLKERLILIQALETARCFEEKVLTDPREADVGAILGFGYAPWTGGPLSWIDMVGAARFVARCRAHEAAHGKRYAPCQWLLDMAAKGETVYPTRANGVKKRHATA